MIEAFDDIPKIHHWLDLEKRENFLVSINLKHTSESQPLKRVIATYELSPKVYCGISSCKTAHHKGFLVELFDGSETIVGHCCGKKYFGNDFTVEKNRLIKLSTDKRNYEIIQDFIKILPEKKHEHNSIFYGNDLVFSFKSLMLSIIHFNSNIKEKISPQTLSNISHEGVISELVKKSKREIEIERLANQMQYIDIYDRQYIDKIENFNIFFQIKKFYSVKEYFSNIFTFLEFSRTGFTSKQLKTYGRLISEFDSHIYEMRRFTDQGFILLNKSNLEKFKLAISSNNKVELDLIGEFINRHGVS